MTASVSVRPPGLLEQTLRDQVAFDREGRKYPLSSSIPPASVARMQELIRTYKPRQTLEVGCAMGVSTLAILEELARSTGGHHTAIDPNQSGDAPDHWHGIGAAMVSRAGLASSFQLIEEPSYAALPELLRQGRRFDLIFIDGWHSFDFTFIDYFYADLMLNDGGILIFDDAEMPQVHHVCRFLEEHKAYQRLGPAPHGSPLSLFARLRQRLFRDTSDHSPTHWGSIYAYRKLKTTTVPWGFFETNFYPGFRSYRWWMRLRGLKPQARF